MCKCERVDVRACVRAWYAVAPVAGPQIGTLVPPTPPAPRGIEPGNTAFETPEPGASFVRAPDFSSAPPPDPDPYAAFEQRVSATFAKLQSAAERTNARLSFAE